MSHAILVGSTNPIMFFRAFDTDGTAKVDLASAEAGLTLSVYRTGGSSVTISSLSDKAADDTAHADGAIRQVGSGNLYTVDAPDAAVASQFGAVSVKGSYTAGVIEGVPHPLVGYDGTTVAVGANTVVPSSAAADVAEHDATQAAVAALNDFDPAADAVANVTLVATTTTNSDMRGTDGANTTTPPTVGAVADAVLDEAMAGHTTADSLGLFLNDQYDLAVTGITTGVETRAGKHSVAGTVMMSTNAALSGGTLTAKKPSDDTTFQTYTVTTDSAANNITGMS